MMVDGGWTRAEREIFERISRWRKGMSEEKFGAEAGELFGRNVWNIWQKVWNL